MAKFEGKIGTAIFNAQKRFLKNSPHDVQIKGGGVKGLLNNVKKTALFLHDGFPKQCNFFHFNCAKVVKV